MARVFLSHSSRDNEAASQIFDWLTSQGFERGFLDIDKHHGIPPGAKWEQKLYDELERANAVVLLLTKNWFDSKWCFAEFAQARSRGKAIFPVIISPEGDQYVGDDLQKLDLTRDREGGLDRLAAGLTDVALSSQGGFDFSGGRAPYPGFFAFDEDDAAIYFGRDDDTRRLIQRLESRRIEGGRRFIVILGESGTGKSSLIRAGVIPRLKRAKRDWVTLAAFRPGEDPFIGLARSLREVGAEVSAATLPGSEPVAIAEAVATARDAHRAAILIVIDQFEELFTRTPPARSAEFLGFLSRLLGPDLPFVVAATMRSDHLGDLQRAASPEFEEFSLKPLPVERVGEIIRGPARVAGIDVEEGLVARIAADTTSTDALPLVAFALRRLYDDLGPERRMTLAEYERLRDAVAGLSPLETIVRDTAGKVIAEVAPTAAELKALREAFVPGLVRVNDEGGFVRQAAGWDALPPASHRLIEALAGPAARLLVIRDQRGRREVEVTHEALFRVWPLLAGWLAEEREFLIGRNRLEKALADWQGLPPEDRDKGLLSGILLRRARQWLVDNPARFSPAEADFIHRSVSVDEERQAREAEQRRALEQAKLRQAETERDAAQRVQRRTRIAAVLLGAIALVAVAAGLLAFRAEHRASDAAAQATLEADRANKETVRATAEADRANAEAARATSNLAIARDTVDRVILDVTQGLRNIEGIRIENLRAILTSVETAMDGLAKAAPNDEDVLRSRGAMLTLFGDTYVAAGDTANAAKAYDEGLAIRRLLLTADPANAKRRRDLSLTLMRYGDLKMRTGDVAAALASYAEGLDLAKTLGAETPNDADAQADIWIGLVKVGDAHTAAGDTPGALKSYEDALALARKIAESAPGTAEWQRNIVQSLIAVGDGHRTMGETEQALATYQDALDLSRKLYAADKGNTQRQRDLAISLQKVGDQTLAKGDAKTALADFTESLGLVRQTSASDPGNKDWQADLAIALEKTADAQLAGGDATAALATYQEELGIERGLVAADPGNREWQRGVAVALERIGDLKFNANDTTGALAAYEESQSIAQKLAESDPANLAWQRDVLLGFNKVGAARLKAGDFNGSLASFEQAVAIARQLVAHDPTNAERQADLVLTLGQYQILILDKDKRRAVLTEAIGIIERLDAAGQLPAPMRMLTPMLKQQLAELG